MSAEPPWLGAMGAIVHKFVDRGGGAGFANVTLASGERVFFSLAATSFRLHRLHLGGVVPGATLYACDGAAYRRLLAQVRRDADSLPPLPDRFQLDATIDGMIEAIQSATVGGAAPDFDDLARRPLTLLTRLGLAAPDSADLVRRLTRAANTG